MNAGQICDICNALREQGKNISPSELVWGTRDEKIDLIKMMVLAILLNDVERNPFMNLTLSEWIETSDSTPQEQVKADMPEMEETYRYFINPQNHMLFELLQTGFDKSYERISNVILKQLLMSEGFSACFTGYLKHCSDYESQKYKALVKDYLMNKGSYSDFILDKNNYLQFISAFKRYWERMQEEYMQFFEHALFVGDDVLREKGMREIQNEKIHRILISPEFLEINEWSLLTSEYTDIDIAVACMRQRLSMVSIINKDNDEMFCGDDEIELTTQ